MAYFWNNIIIEVIAELIAGLVICVISDLWHGMGKRARRRGETDEPPLLDWREWGYLLVIISALAGCVLISVGLVMKLYDITIPAEWRLWPLLASWAIYLVLSFGVGFFGQGILSAYKGLGRVVTVENERRRQAIFMGSVWAELAALLPFLGWALMAAPNTMAQPLSWSFVTFLGVDAVVFIIILLTD